MRVRPVSYPVLVREIVERVAGAAESGAAPAAWLRVGVDGPAAGEPERLAGALVDPLRTRGHHAQVVRAADFLRPASVRLERGRTNPDSFYESWLDLAGMRREVLEPLAAHGSGRILPTLWDADRDRATRARYVTLPPGGVVLVAGALLLGAGLPFDLTVHLDLSPGALRRRTPAEQAWTLPAYERYTDEVDPARLADIVIRADDPDHPAVVDAW